MQGLVFVFALGFFFHFIENLILIVICAWHWFHHLSKILAQVEHQPKWNTFPWVIINFFQFKSECKLSLCAF